MVTSREIQEIWDALKNGYAAAETIGDRDQVTHTDSSGNVTIWERKRPDGDWTEVESMANPNA